MLSLRHSVFALTLVVSACGAFGGSDSSSNNDTSDAGEGGIAGQISGPASTLTSMATQPSSITTDTKSIYWADKAAGTINAIAKSGGMPRTVASGTDQPDYLYSIGDKLYWLETRGGCPSHNHLLAQGKDSTGMPGAIWGNDSQCYGTYRMTSTGAEFYVQQDNTIVLVGLPTGARSALTGAESVISGIAGDGRGMYFTGMNQIKVAPQPGTGATTFVSGLMSPTEIAVDSTTVYWIDQAAGAIRKLDRNKPNTLPTDVATGLSTSATGAFRMAIDADTIYFTSRDDGTVKAVPKAGGMVRTLADKENGPFAIAVDDDGLYWGNVGDHTIRMIHR